MSGRKYSAAGSYRYGFNGKENDNDVKGEGNQQDYGMRIYDPRMARFLTVDPLRKAYPMLTPYQYASNKPINSIDVDGKEADEAIHWLATVGTSRAAAALAAPTLDLLFDISEKQTYYIFGFANGYVSAFDIKGLVKNYMNYQLEAMKEIFSSKLNTLIQEDLSYERFKKMVPIVSMTKDAYNGIKNTIQLAYGGDPYAAGQIQAMCFTACIGGLASSDLVALRTASNIGAKASEILASKITVSIPYEDGIAVQSASAASLDGMVNAAKGAKLYRIGTKGKSKVGVEAQHWSMINPLDDPEGYARAYGIPLNNVKNADFVESATLKPGANFVTREAPAAPGSAPGSGGGIEVVVEKGGTTNNVITPVKNKK